jgi:hypothetical protein
LQTFYDWYVPVANGDRRYRALWEVFKVRPEVLDSALLGALRVDSASGPNPTVAMREILEFDPLLESQDPCPRYEVVAVRAAALGYRVTVRPVCADSTWQKQRPVVSVVRQGNAWRITNVYYEKSDLRTMLCEFAKTDKRPERRSLGC